MLDDLADGDVLDTAWSAACCASDESGKSIPKQYTLDVKKPGRRITLETQSANATVIRNKSDVVACNGVIHEVETILPTLPLPLSDDGCESVYDVRVKFCNTNINTTKIGSERNRAADSSLTDMQHYRASYSATRQYVKSKSQFSIFKRLIDRTTKVNNIWKSVSQNPFTSGSFFVPTNKAFEDLVKKAGQSVNALLTESDPVVVDAMLDYHVVPAPSIETELDPISRLMLPTLVSAEFTSTPNWTGLPPGGVNLNSAFGTKKYDTAVKDAAGNSVNIIEQDQACASTIYIIDEVLLPCSVEGLLFNNCGF